jgi:hypothetical protein
MKRLLATLTLATLCASAHAQQIDLYIHHVYPEVVQPAPLTDAEWKAQADQSMRRQNYIDDQSFTHAQAQIDSMVDHQNCMFNKRYGYSKKDCD